MHSDFRAVADEFSLNFSRRREIGASLHIIQNGQTVVDLWAGQTDEETDLPWERGTLANVFSCSKVAAVLSTHLLAQKGELDLHAPVSDYWPEFAQFGKASITTGHLLAHTSGLPLVNEHLSRESLLDGHSLAAAIAAAPPDQMPGNSVCYQAFSMPYLLGEVIYRITGQSLLSYYVENIAGPNKVDFHLSLGPKERERICTLVPLRAMLKMVTANSNVLNIMIGEESHLLRRAVLTSAELFKDRHHEIELEIGKFFGGASAKGMADLMNLTISDGQFFNEATRSRLTECVSSTLHDPFFEGPARFSLGMMLGTSNMAATGKDKSAFRIPEGAYGHAGWGGSTMFADPKNKLAFGYCMNRLGGGRLINRRGQSLIEACYKAIAQQNAQKKRHLHEMAPV